MIAIIIITLLALLISLILNFRFYKAHNNLIAFFNNEYLKIDSDLKFFVDIAEKNVVTDDPIVRRWIRRVQSVRDRYKDYANSNGFPHSESH